MGIPAALWCVYIYMCVCVGVWVCGHPTMRIQTWWVYSHPYENVNCDLPKSWPWRCVDHISVPVYVWCTECLWDQNAQCFMTYLWWFPRTTVVDVRIYLNEPLGGRCIRTCLDVLGWCFTYTQIWSNIHLQMHDICIYIYTRRLKKISVYRHKPRPI